MGKKPPSKIHQLIGEQGYLSRSEAIRDLIRRQINTAKLSHPNANAVAAVNLVYNHHSAKLMEKLVNLQHNHHLHTISSMHIHLNAHDCLEMIVLKGKVSKINKMPEVLAQPFFLYKRINNNIQDTIDASMLITIARHKRTKTLTKNG